MSNKYDSILGEYREEDSASSGGGIAIGDTIGNFPDDDGVFFSDGGVLANDAFGIQATTLLGQPTTKLYSKTLGTTKLNLDFVDITGFGLGYALALTLPTGTDGSFRFFNRSNGANFFNVSVASGVITATLGGNLDMTNSKITSLSPGATTGHGVEFDQMNTAISTAVAAYIPKSLADAKGDIFTATADNTPARLAVGTDGYVLSADSGAGTGLSWIPAPSGGSLSIGDTIGNSPVAAGVFFDDGSGNFINSTNFKYDNTNFNTKHYRNDNTQNTSILGIYTETGRSLVEFSTPNTGSITQFAVREPGSGNHGINFRASAPDQDVNVEIGNGLVFWYFTGAGNVNFGLTPGGIVYLGPWNFATTLGNVNAYNDEPSRISMAVRGAASQAADLQGWFTNANVKVASVGKDGVIYPVSAATASAPTYVEGGIYYDVTLHKLRVGGAAGWETITSV